MEDDDGSKPWDEAMSGWRSNFLPAPTQLRRQRSDLLALMGRRLQAGWTGWHPERDQWDSDIPLVLVFDGGVQLELAWQAWNSLSITWNTIDLRTTPLILGWPHEWRSSELDPLAAVAGRTLTGWAVTESPYFRGDVDLSGELPMDNVAGWSTSRRNAQDQTTLLRTPAWTDGTLADRVRYQLDVLTVREFLQRWKIDPNGAPA
ncbi:hypothetical protein [Dactylosporangium sp. NPDC051484]|uniref:hypothetical protein n=1 Tax=Dactylosporangium sp. NPDC051484 TaxID=3154942 RepID=UPI00344DE532